MSTTSVDDEVAIKTRRPAITDDKPSAACSSVARFLYDNEASTSCPQVFDGKNLSAY